MKVFVIDQEKCNGCYNCQIACKDEHVGTDWMPYAKAQPNTGQFWMKVSETVHGQTPKVNVEYLPTPCMHCGDAPCMKVAKDDAVYRRDDGLILIDPEKAKGQKAIVAACPYHAVFWNEELQTPQKCTGCAHLVDAGEQPHCVNLCPSGALRFGDYEEFSEELENAEVLLPEASTSPHVYYLNRPKLFVAGDIWDVEADECLEGVSVTLRNCTTKEEVAQTSDRYGDFMFEKLEPAEYSLNIQSEKYHPVNVDFTLDKSTNLGNFPLKVKA